VGQPDGEQERERKAVETDRIKIFTGNANPALAEEICTHLNVPLGRCSVKQFSDGEVYLQVKENVRGADVFVLQPSCQPSDRHLMELLLLIDALKRASARRITAVIPYYGYARQDRKDKPRVPISAKLIADLLTTAGANRALTMDLHAPQIQGFFNIPVDHLFATPVLVEYFEALQLEDVTVIAPDAGGVERSRFFAKKLNAPLAIIDKRREEVNVAEVMHVIGDVDGRTVLIVDDIIDTGGTLVKNAEALLERGAKRVFATASHAVLSGSAVERLCNSRIEQVVVTNSIPLKPEAANCGRIKVLSIAALMARAIQSIHEETSVSRLFI